MDFDKKCSTREKLRKITVNAKKFTAYAKVHGFREFHELAIFVRPYSHDASCTRQKQKLVNSAIPVYVGLGRAEGSVEL